MPLALTIGGETTRQRWLTVCGAHARRRHLLASALGGSLYAAVAAPLQPTRYAVAYCFLPLPIATGLPLRERQLALIQPARAKGADGDAGGGHAAKARWNALLCEEALPELLVHALEHAAADAAIGRDRLDRLWPRGASGGRWSTLEQRALRLLSSRSSEVCYDLATRRMVPLAQVVAADATLATQCAQPHSALASALTAAGVALWLPPTGALAALAAAGVVVERSSPRRVCDCLRGGADGWDRTLARDVLAYAFAAAEATDDGAADADGSDGADADDELAGLLAAAPLVGLPVLPLADGTMGVLRRRPRGRAAAEDSYFVAEAEAARLLAGCPLMLDPATLALPGWAPLSELAQLGGFNVGPLDAAAILRPACLAALLPPSWAGRRCVGVRAAADLEGSSEDRALALEAPEAAADDEPKAAAGWKAGGGRKKKKEKRGAIPAVAAAPAPAPAAAPAEVDEAAVDAALRLLWRLIDDGRALIVGDSSLAAALDEWPTVLTSGGLVLSVSHARARHVLRADAFDAGGAEAAVLRRVGVLFAAHDHAYLSERVCVGPHQHLGAALEAAVPASAAHELPRADCLALRALVLGWCMPGSADAAAADADDDGEPALTRRDSSRHLSRGVLRRLPIFDTLGQRQCVRLAGTSAIAAGRDGWQPTSSWDTTLAAVAPLSDELLRLEDDDERALLRLADQPRASAAEFARFLGLRLGRAQLPEAASCTCSRRRAPPRQRANSPSARL